MSRGTHTPIVGAAGALSTIGTLLILLASASASAGAPPAFFGADAQTRTPVVVTDEHMEVECHGGGTRLRCVGRSVMALHNPTGNEEVVVLVVDQEATGLTVDGETADMAGQPTSGEAVLLSTPLVLAANEHRTLEVRYDDPWLLDGSAAAGDILDPVLVTRHPLMAPYPGKPTPVQIDVSGSNPRRWSGVERHSARIRFPSRWTLQPSSTVVASPVSEGRTDASARSDEPADRTPWRATAVIAVEEQTFHNGGPILGVGVLWNDVENCGKAECGRTKVGYEVGVGSAVILGMSGEFGGDREEVLAPVVEYGLVPSMPGLPGVPSVGLGLGMPVRITAKRAAGLRIQATAMWPSIGDSSVGIVGYGEHLFSSSHEDDGWRFVTAFQVGM